MAKTNASPQKTAAQGATIARPKQIVPPADFIAHGVSPIPNAPAPILTNHGGTVLQSVQVVPIYWGNTILGDAAMKTAFDQFFAELLNSHYVDRLAQYNVGQPLVLPSHAIGGTATSVSSSDVATQLTDWFSTNTVPAPSPLSDAPNWYYVILAPPGADQMPSSSCSRNS